MASTRQTNCVMQCDETTQFCMFQLPMQHSCNTCVLVVTHVAYSVFWQPWWANRTKVQIPIRPSII